MRWKYPREGDTRTRRIFAWLPKRHGGVAYWLCRLEVEEKYWVSHLNPFPRWWVLVGARPVAEKPSGEPEAHRDIVEDFKDALRASAQLEEAIGQAGGGMSDERELLMDSARAMAAIAQNEGVDPAVRVEATSALARLAERMERWA